MKKLSALILTLLILMLAGCKSNATESGTVSDFQSDTALIKNSSTAETDNSSSEENSSKDESAPEMEKTITVPTNSKPNNVSGNSKQSEISSSEKTLNSTTENTPNNKPTEYKTIQLETVTTYYGYTGYFTLSMLQSDVHLVELGIGTDNSKALICASEYIDIDSNKTLRFIFEGDIRAGKDLMYNHVYPAGAGKTPAKTFYDLKTIKLFELTTYCSYTGYFSDSNISSWEDSHLKLLGRDNFIGVTSVITEYKNIENGNMLWFIFYDDKGTSIDNTGKNKVLVKVKY